MWFFFRYWDSGTTVTPPPDTPAATPGTGGWFPQVFGYAQRRRHLARTIEAVDWLGTPAAHVQTSARAAPIAGDDVCAAVATPGAVRCRGWPVLPEFESCNRARGRYFPGEAEALLLLLGYMETTQ